MYVHSCINACSPGCLTALVVKPKVKWLVRKTFLDGKYKILKWTILGVFKGPGKLWKARRCHPLCWFYSWPNIDLWWTGTDLSQDWKTIGRICHLGYRSDSIQRHNRHHPRQIWIWNRSESARTIIECHLKGTVRYFVPVYKLVNLMKYEIRTHSILDASPTYLRGRVFSDVFTCKVLQCSCTNSQNILLHTFFVVNSVHDLTISNSENKMFCFCKRHSIETIAIICYLFVFAYICCTEEGGKLAVPRVCHFKDMLFDKEYKRKRYGFFLEKKCKRKNWHTHIQK